MIANAICNDDLYHLKLIFESKSSDLVMPLCNALVMGHEAACLLNVLQAVSTLMNLDD